jgi:adenylyltransferase/sulfurtransferase
MGAMPRPAVLTPEERRRYSRHLLMPEFGEEAQRRVKQASVLVIGAGGLGSPAALYLAAAGVGTIGLVEFDAVDETNLQRQILYGTPDIGRPKVEVAAERLTAQNPLVTVVPHAEVFDTANALALVSNYDVVVDGTDNFPTRYLVNDACVMAKRPNVYGSVSRFEGQAAVFATAEGPCYRCLHPEPPPPGLIANCADAGVLGVMPGIIGTIQATEALKVVAGIGEPLVGRLLLFDALRMQSRVISLPRDPECPVCGDHPRITSLVRYDDNTCAVQPDGTDMTADELRALREAGTAHVLIDVREPSEHAQTSIEGSILIPLATLNDRLDVIPRDRPVVVHCQGGGRSARAVSQLRAQGFDAHNLVGGIKAWNQSGG